MTQDPLSVLPLFLPMPMHLISIGEEGKKMEIDPLLQALHLLVPLAFSQSEVAIIHIPQQNRRMH
jgi:hypothetical protein